METMPKWPEAWKLNARLRPDGLEWDGDGNPAWCESGTRNIDGYLRAPRPDWVAALCRDAATLELAKDRRLLHLVRWNDGRWKVVGVGFGGDMQFCDTPDEALFAACKVIFATPDVPAGC